MNHISRFQRRKLLKGWGKWALLPVVLFSAPFFDAWLNIQICLKDQELAQVNAEGRALATRIVEENSELSKLRGLENLLSKAREMGLSAPGMHQFHPIAYRKVPRNMPVSRLNDFEIAQTAPELKTIFLGVTPEVSELNSREIVVASDLSPVVATPERASSAAVMQDVVSEQAARAPLLEQEDPELISMSVEEMLATL